MLLYKEIEFCNVLKEQMKEHLYRIPTTKNIIGIMKNKEIGGATEMYTAGSKRNNRVGCIMFDNCIEECNYKYILSNECSVYIAELVAIHFAVNYVSNLYVNNNVLFPILCQVLLLISIILLLLLITSGGQLFVIILIYIRLRLMLVMPAMN